MRQPKPWFRFSTNSWYVECNGKQCRLGNHPDDSPPPNKSEKGWNVPASIMHAFYKVMAQDPANLPTTATVATAQVCDLFLDHAERHNEPATYRWYQYFLQDFCESFGRVPAKDLKPIHVTRWLDSHPSWDGGRRNAVTAVKRAFNFADQQGILYPNPLRNVQKPAGRKRTRILTEKERVEIQNAIKDRHFRDFVFAMLQTGCRPSEVAKVTAANVDLKLGVWVLDQHKAGTRTGKPRVVYLNPVMLRLRRKLVVERPVGPLFPSLKLGRPFTRNAIRCRFRRLRKKLPHLEPFICYNLRHTYATDALANGVSAAQVAELLGHSSLRLVEPTGSSIRNWQRCSRQRPTRRERSRAIRQARSPVRTGQGNCASAGSNSLGRQDRYAGMQTDSSDRLLGDLDLSANRLPCQPKSLPVAPQWDRFPFGRLKCLRAGSFDRRSDSGGPVVATIFELKNAAQSASSIMIFPLRPGVPKRKCLRTPPAHQA